MIWILSYPSNWLIGIFQTRIWNCFSFIKTQSSENFYISLLENNYKYNLRFWPVIEIKILDDLHSFQSVTSIYWHFADQRIRNCLSFIKILTSENFYISLMKNNYNLKFWPVIDIRNWTWSAYFPIRHIDLMVFWRPEYEIFWRCH